VAHLFLELAGKVRAQDYFALRGIRDVAPPGHVYLELRVVIGFWVGARDVVRDPEAHPCVSAGLRADPDFGEGNGHPADLFDLGDFAERHQGTAETLRTRGLVGHLHVRAEMSRDAREQRME